MSAETKSTAETLADAIQAGETTLDKCKERVKAGKLDAFDLIDAQEILKGRAKAGPARDITFKVTEKGGVSAYGLNARFPVTLYADQWERLLAKRDELLAFIKTNEKSLSRK